MKEGQTNLKTRIEVFDGLKGLSIMLILMYYFFQHILPGGFLAVNTFLMIAGFFNFRYFYLKSLRNEPVGLWTFYHKRLNRLFFPMLGMIIGVIPFILLFARDYLYNLRNMGLASLLFVNNYYQILNKQSYFVQAANPSAFTHLWYVALLGQLLLLTPLMVMLFFSWHKKKTIAANFLVIVSVISMILIAYWYKEGDDPTFVYYSLFTRGFAYTLGGAIGMLFPPLLKAKPMPMKLRHIFNLTGLISVIALFLMAKFMYGTSSAAFDYGMTLFTLFSALLLFSSLHPQTLFNKIISFKPFAYLGRRSYSIYLWYYPVYLIIPDLVGAFSKNSTVLLSIQAVLLLILSEVSYRLFEQRQIDLPIGQDFNFRKMRYQFKVLRNATGRYGFIKFLTGAYLVLLFISIVGAFMAPEAKNNTANDIQKVIEKNKELAVETQSEESQEIKVINNVEGLTQQELLYANGLDITFFGDSILLSAADKIKEIFPKAVVDGEVGRQLYLSVGQIKWLDSEGLLKPTVVTVLGSNGNFSQGQMNDYVEAVGENRSQFYVTANVDRPWEADTNNMLFDAAQRFGNVNIIDWKNYSVDHPDWLYDDGAHPNEIGAHEFAVFIAKELYRQRIE